MGRPPHGPTEKTRRLVEHHAAIGTLQEHIATRQYTWTPLLSTQIMVMQVLFVVLVTFRRLPQQKWQWMNWRIKLDLIR